MHGGPGRGRLHPGLPARGRHPGWGTPGCSKGCEEPAVSCRFLGMYVRVLSRLKPARASFFRLLTVTVITVKESEVSQSCPTPCNPMGCSLPGPSVHEILQASILERVAMSFSRGSSQPRDWTMKLMSDLRATLSSHPVCDSPGFREEQGDHFRSPIAVGRTGWGPKASCPALLSLLVSAPAALLRTPPQAAPQFHVFRPRGGRLLCPPTGHRSGGMAQAPTLPETTQPRPPSPCGRGAGAVCPLQPPGPHVRAQ